MLDTFLNEQIVKPLSPTTSQIHISIKYLYFTHNNKILTRLISKECLIEHQNNTICQVTILFIC